MTFEGDIASLNEHFFFEEFTYSTNTFRPGPSTELELADSIIWLDDMLVVFQLKERGKIGKTSPDREASPLPARTVRFFTFRAPLGIFRRVSGSSHAK